MGHSDLDPAVHERQPWNAGYIIGPKRPLRPRDIWAIRFFLDEHKRLRDRALFDFAIDSKLRGCDIVKIRIGDLVSGGTLRNRAIVIQQKTGRPVQFEIMTDTRKSLNDWFEGGSGCQAMKRPSAMVGCLRPDPLERPFQQQTAFSRFSKPVDELISPTADRGIKHFLAMIVSRIGQQAAFADVAKACRQHFRFY
jgi:hypothetical protein